MMLKNKRHVMHALPVIIRDVTMVAVILVVFALFHHVLPRSGKVLQNIVDPNSVATVVPATPDTIPTDAAANNSAVQTQAEAQFAAPTPTSAVYTPGDFTAAFPSADTGVGALHSYQSDDLRIAINMVQANDVTYYVADVWVKSISTFKTAFAKGEYGTAIHQEPKKIAQANNAIFAFTGDYCGARNSGVVIRNGDLYRDSVSSDVCVLYADGVMATYSQADFNVMDAVDNAAWQAWGFGPRLLDDNGGAIIEFDSSIKGKNPRNAMGYYEPGHYCFITVDGRQKGYSVGMTLAELSQVFADLGCKAAFNLDGGATAEMLFNGELVNRPYKGGRQSSDIICFGEGN